MILVELHGRSDVLVQRLSGAKAAAYHAVLDEDGGGTFQIHRSDPDVATYGILTGGIDGWIVHLLRQSPLGGPITDRFAFTVEGVTNTLDDQEDASGWITVSGRGTLCLLEDRVAFPPGFDGTNPATISAQWQQYTAVSGGAIMAGEIDRSNGRFATALTHSVNQSTVQQTVKLRFDNLRKLHDYLVENGMDAEMVGLDYRAYNHQGADRSAQVTVKLGPQDSLLDLKLEHDVRPVKNWVVAQGTGEGINAPLAIAADSASITALRRREGFLDSREADSATQLGLRATSAVSQLKDPDQRITIGFFDSTHTQLYREFFLGDTITLDAQTRLGIKAPYRVVGIQVADTDQEIEDVHLDLNSMRQEYLIALKKGTDLTADSLNVINRMPQGAPFNDSQAYPDSCDSTHPFRFDLYLPANILKLNYAKLSFKLRAFRADVAGAPAVTSGASSAASSAAGSSHSHSISGTATGGESSTHTHTVSHNNAAPTHLLGYDDGLALVADGVSGAFATNSNGGGHTHSISGSTSGAEGSHTHGISHTHDVTPSLTYGIFEGTTATNVRVIINGTDRTSALGGGSGFTGDQTELEVASYLAVGQWNTVELQPTNLGRIVGHLRVTGYIQSN